MPLGQIADVDVVALARAVLRGVIAAEDAQKLPPPFGHLGNKGHQVVRQALRVFTNQAACMCPHRVEVAQPCNAPLAGLGGIHIGQHLLHHQLAPAVGVGGREREIFTNWQTGRVAIHRGRRRKHQRAHIGRLHRLQQGDGARHIVFVIAQWLRHRFAHGLERREMNHALNREAGKNIGQQGRIAHIAFDALGLLPGNLPHALQH